MALAPSSSPFAASSSRKPTASLSPMPPRHVSPSPPVLGQVWEPLPEQPSSSSARESAARPAKAPRGASAARAGPAVPVKAGKRPSWSAEEDRVLLRYVERCGPRRFNALRERGLLQRDGKSCRQRWSSWLRPDRPNQRKSRSRIDLTADEEERLRSLQATMGNKWAQMSSFFPRHTAHEIKNLWHGRVKKKLLGLSAEEKKPSEPSEKTSSLKSSSKPSPSSSSAPSNPTPHFHSSSSTGVSSNSSPENSKSVQNETPSEPFENKAGSSPLSSAPPTSDIEMTSEEDSVESGFPCTAAPISPSIIVPKTENPPLVLPPLRGTSSSSSLTELDQLAGQIRRQLRSLATSSNMGTGTGTVGVSQHEGEVPGMLSRSSTATTHTGHSFELDSMADVSSLSFFSMQSMAAINAKHESVSQLTDSIPDFGWLPAAAPLSSVKVEHLEHATNSLHHPYFPPASPTLLCPKPSLSPSLMSAPTTFRAQSALEILNGIPPCSPLSVKHVPPPSSSSALPLSTDDIFERLKRLHSSGDNKRIHHSLPSNFSSSPTPSPSPSPPPSFPLLEIRTFSNHSTPELSCRGIKRPHIPLHSTRHGPLSNKSFSAIEHPSEDSLPVASQKFQGLSSYIWRGPAVGERKEMAEWEGGEEMDEWESVLNLWMDNGIILSTDV